MKTYKIGDAVYLKALERREHSFPAEVVKVGRKWVYVAKEDCKDKEWTWIPVDIKSGDAKGVGKEYSATHKMYDSKEEAMYAENADRLCRLIRDELNREIQKTLGRKEFSLEKLIQVADILGIDTGKDGK